MAQCFPRIVAAVKPNQAAAGTVSVSVKKEKARNDRALTPRERDGLFGEIQNACQLIPDGPEGSGQFGIVVGVEIIFGAAGAILQTLSEAASATSSRSKETVTTRMPAFFIAVQRAAVLLSAALTDQVLFGP
jgi:hypothetical protein